MIVIEDKIVSEDIIEENFVCDLAACKGACCVDGDVGAPLLETELGILETIYDKVKPFLTTEGIQILETNGKHVIIEDNYKLTTPLMKNGHCAYINYESGIAVCGIEKAWKAGIIEFQKPVSCHLYPVRVTKHKSFEAVNYERWSICKAACKNGNKLKVPVYKFVKDALVRRFGVEFYKALEDYAAAYKL